MEAVGDNTGEPMDGNHGSSSPFELKATLIGHRKGIAVVRFSPDGKWLASAGEDEVIHLWDGHTGDHIRILDGHASSVNDICFSRDSMYIASASEDKTARIWSVESGHSLRTLNHHTAPVLSIDFHPKGNILATGSTDETVILWDVKSGTPMHVLPAHSDPISSVAFHPEGGMLVTSSFDGLIRFWDSSTGQCLKTIEDERNAPMFTPNGSYLISSALSSTIRIWNYYASKCLKTYTGHVNEKYCASAVIFRPNSDLHPSKDSHIEGMVISGSDENTAHVWILQSRETIGKIEGHTDTVIAVAAHPFLEMIATAGMERDKTIKLWRYAAS